MNNAKYAIRQTKRFPGGLRGAEAEAHARSAHGNVNEGNFDDCFRYWETGSFGVWENV